MVKPAEVKQVLAHNPFHISLMVYTAVVVILTDFLIGVVSAILIWGLLYRFFDKPVPVHEQLAVQN
jgi:MFS superfamily sulfate permease-like transporter